MFVGTARTGDPEAPEIVPSDHCVARYRERMPIRVPGLDEVGERAVGDVGGRRHHPLAAGLGGV